MVLVLLYVLCVTCMMMAAPTAMGQSPTESIQILDDTTTVVENISQPLLTPNAPNTGCSEIYEVSTRHLPEHFHAINLECPNVEINRWAGNRWVRSNIPEAFPTEGSGKLTIVYVHGNFMERNNALERVRIIDCYLRRQTNRDYKLIMLSWPSQRERKPLRDVRSNSESAECQALYMAWMLRQLRNEPQVSIMGFSFGAKAVTGGLHLDAGGCIPGFANLPPDPTANQQLYRLGLVAPAIDRDWIEPRGRHQLALNNVESLVNLYNSRDPILRRFRFLDRFTRPIAAGFAGFDAFADPRATSPLAGNQSRIRQYDCGSIIGTTHSEKSYYGECPYFRLLIQHVLWMDVETTACNAPITASNSNADIQSIP